MVHQINTKKQKKITELIHNWSGTNGPVPDLIRDRYYTFHKIVHNMIHPIDHVLIQVNGAVVVLINGEILIQKTPSAIYR